MTLAQFTEHCEQHSAYNAGASTPDSARDEFSLEGLPVEDGSYLVNLAERHGGLRRVPASGGDDVQQ